MYIYRIQEGKSANYAVTDLKSGVEEIQCTDEE